MRVHYNGAKKPRRREKLFISRTSAEKHYSQAPESTTQNSNIQTVTRKRPEALFQKEKTNSHAQPK